MKSAFARTLTATVARRSITASFLPTSAAFRALSRSLSTSRVALASESTGKPTGDAPEPSGRYKRAVGMLSWQSAALFVATAIGLGIYFQHEKSEMQRRRLEQAQQQMYIGRPKIGGPFELIDHNGKTVTDADFKGRFKFIYFGFTHCPDICPEELDKLTEVYEGLLKDPEIGNVITPIFISCDPNRDTPEQVREYLVDFHPDLVGLTGTFEQVARAAKAYRVYFSRPPKVAPGEDYLVDHSIFIYLMAPDGSFMETFGRDKTAEESFEVSRRLILEHLAKTGGADLAPATKA
ncbi:SCO1 protein [Ramicandelaber brevisporus]|nr:SCO1 protein [Ramicandelaber brevisporus]